MMNPQRDMIWVIVPVYNAQKYIRRCVRSVQRQSYTNWKLVLVDDGSVDRSGQICDELARKDQRLIVLHTPNSGAHQARVNGIRLVNDDGYVIFCDSDDELAPNALELLHAEAVRSDSDMVCGDMSRILKGIKLPHKPSAFYAETRCYTHEQIMREIFVSCLGLGGFSVSLCSKLYQSGTLKSIMTNLGKSPKSFAEDLNVTLHLLPVLRKISVIPDVVYYYRFGGGTSRFMPTFLEDNLIMYRIKMQHAHLSTSEYDEEFLIAVELKNIVGTYLLMCEKFRTYPHNSLAEEIAYICDLEEVRDALGRFENDHSGIAGFADALRARDIPQIQKLILNELHKTRIKDFVKKLIFH